MELQDDFDSLLKGAADRYGQASLSEQTVSKIIDVRLTESKNMLRATFRKEIMIIAVCLLLLVYIIAKTFITPHLYKLPVLQSLRVALIGGLVYLAASIFLFLKLMRVARLHKDTGVREYLQSVCAKTEHALFTYLWISTIASTWMVGTIILGFTVLSWYWVAISTIILGIVIYYLNAWYTNKRFGKQLNEMKILLNEFK